MTPFNVVTGTAAPLNRPNIDTDQIIPKQFLKRIERTGFGEFLFYDWRFQEDGKTPRPEFVLNQPQYQSAKILIAGKNFGCGSSREHAPWALADFGFRAVIAPSYADIFFNNCFQNGMLPIVLPEEKVNALVAYAEQHPGSQLTIDLADQTVGFEGQDSTNFDVDSFRKRCLLEGLDDIGLTLKNEAAISRFEALRPGWLQSTALGA
jgi:3-isopropylmalate/(R)-2-methylmalate dehydratase small subunit